MSMKIYDACTITAPDPWPVRWRIRGLAADRARSRLLAACDDIVSGRANARHDWCLARDLDYAAWCEETRTDPLFGAVDYPCAARMQHPPRALVAVANSEVMGTRTGAPKRGDAAAWIVRRYLDQLSQPERNEFDLDVRVEVYVEDGRMYLLPRCDDASLLRGCLGSMERLTDVESFAYWDHTDRPDDVPK